MTLLRRAQVGGRVTDVRFDDSRVLEIGDDAAPERDEDVLDADGGALLPGLHDHHMHVLATARAASSIDVTEGLAALAAAPPGPDWLRAVGAVDDRLDAPALDRVVPARPVRVQHHSGALWVLNSAGLRAIGATDADHPGIERDEHGRPTGRLWRADDWLATRVPDSDPPDVAALSDELAGYGITGVTDATPSMPERSAALLAEMRQRVHSLAELPPDGGAGPRKIVLADHALPSYDDLGELVAASRAEGRPVAVHCVTRAALLLTLALLEDQGAQPGDRIEHAAVAGPGEAARIASLGVAVVTQPGFIASRGDRYLRDVDDVDLPDLYPYASLVTAGATVVPSSDAPYGPLDPWQVMRAARDRRTAAGRVVNPGERVDVATVLDGYLRPLDDLCAPSRRVVVGAPADLVLLHVPLADALADPTAEVVRQAWATGGAAAQR